MSRYLAYFVFMVSLTACQGNKRVVETKTVIVEQAQPVRISETVIHDNQDLIAQSNEHILLNAKVIKANTEAFEANRQALERSTKAIQSNVELIEHSTSMLAKLADLSLNPIVYYLILFGLCVLVVSPILLGFYILWRINQRNLND